MKHKTSAQTKQSDAGNSAAAEEWREVLDLAWRPAWSMRSRKDCFTPLIAWWKRHRTQAD